MPTISQFFGIIVRMYFNDHAPPHFHVQYNEYQAVVTIEDMRITEGRLPRRAQELVLDWAELHKMELMEDWNLCRTKQQPRQIPPLE